MTSLADIAEQLLAAARVPPWNEPDPGRVVSPRSECLRIGNACNQGRGQHRADARNLSETHARLIGSVPSSYHAIELKDLCLQDPQLDAERRDASSCNLWHPLVVRIGNDTNQVLDTLTANRRHDPELR